MGAGEIDLHVLAVSTGRRDFDNVEFQPSFCPVEADPIAFPRSVGVQGIGQDRFVFVADDHAHIVLDADAVAEDAFVPVILILCFRIEIDAIVDFCPAGIRRKRETERVLFGDFTPAAAEIEVGHAAVFGIFLAVKPQ